MSFCLSVMRWASRAISLSGLFTSSLILCRRAVLAMSSATALSCASSSAARVASSDEFVALRRCIMWLRLNRYKAMAMKRTAMNMAKDHCLTFDVSLQNLLSVILLRRRSASSCLRCIDRRTWSAFILSRLSSSDELLSVSWVLASSRLVERSSASCCS